MESVDGPEGRWLRSELAQVVRELLLWDEPPYGYKAKKFRQPSSAKAEKGNKPIPPTNHSFRSGCSTPSTAPSRRRRLTRRRAGPNTHRYTKRTYTFRSRVVCDCGRRMMGHPHERGYTYDEPCSPATSGLRQRFHELQAERQLLLDQLS